MFEWKLRYLLHFHSAAHGHLALGDIGGGCGRRRRGRRVRRLHVLLLLPVVAVQVARELRVHVARVEHRSADLSPATTTTVNFSPEKRTYKPHRAGKRSS